MTNPSSGEPAKPGGHGLPRPASLRHLPHAVHPPHTTKGEDLLEGVGLQPTAAEVREKARREGGGRRGADGRLLPPRHGLGVRRGARARARRRPSPAGRLTPPPLLTLSVHALFFFLI